jgi:hypothetical protein
MRHSTRIIACLFVALFCVFGATLSVHADSLSDSAQTLSGAQWIRLFDGSTLNGWHTQIQGKKKNEDPAKFFQVENGVIHVYKDQPAGIAVPNGYIATDKEYSHYHLRLEFKWGAKRFKPRAAQRRDAGVLYHVVAPELVWPRSVECQIQEGDVGDCFTVRGTQVVTSVENADVTTPSGAVKKLPRYKPEVEGGKPQTIGDGSTTRIVKSHTPEHDGWNTVEVIIRGSEGAEHIVNGETVFRATSLRQLETPPSATPAKGTDTAKQKWVPLTLGRIALQCEYAEVFYRNIEIRPIPGGAFEETAK